MAENEKSLRDEIAIEALNGMLAHSTRYKPREGAYVDWHYSIAKEAYELADAMLKVRNTNPIGRTNNGRKDSKLS
jgi:hypothetical protein